LPIPVTRDVTVFPEDVVIYDAEGYDKLREFLRSQGVRHVLLTGYATDMCYARTCAGYENLSKDFNTFLVGDATLATFPAHDTPSSRRARTLPSRHSTNSSPKSPGSNMNRFGSDFPQVSALGCSTRRDFLCTAARAGAVIGLGGAAMLKPALAQNNADRAQIAITLDLEMARNFPRWNDTEWDYQKGNLNDEAKRYAIEAARRVKAHGGVVHFFLVGQALEQADVEWLKQLHSDGHRIGNHTYDHVYVLATKAEDIQFKFKRSPWLIQGKSPTQVIRDNIQLCTEAMHSRLGFGPDGFRTPGGFENGLAGRKDVQKMLLDCGFKWVSARYPRHQYGTPAEPPTQAVLDDIVRAQADAQPLRYPTGLVDIPMSPISDVGAFRKLALETQRFPARPPARRGMDHRKSGGFRFSGAPIGPLSKRSRVRSDRTDLRIGTEVGQPRGIDQPRTVLRSGPAPEAANRTLLLPGSVSVATTCLPKPNLRHWTDSHGITWQLPACSGR